MNFDLTSLAPREAYKLLTGVVVPRPIALVTTLDEQGRINAAPFSFFNAVGSDPPLIVLGIGNRPDGTPKDTARNIRQGGEFVVNIVDELLAPAMNICSGEFPPGVDELQTAGLQAVSSIQIKPPRIAQSPVNLECREHSILEIGRNRVILGVVLHIHLRDDLIDADKMHVRTEKLRAIGRLGGAGGYCRTSDAFQMERPSKPPQ